MPRSTGTGVKYSSMSEIAADTVAKRLRDRATLLATLDALETHAAPIPTAVSLAAAPALLELTCMDEAEVERDAHDRAGLLLGRLHEEALPDGMLAVHGAALGNGGYERLYNCNSVDNAALRKPAAQLTRADAVSAACSRAYLAPSAARGFDAAWGAAGLTAMEWMMLMLSAEPIGSKKKLPEDEVPAQMLTLLLELLKSNELPELAIGGAWNAVHFCLMGRLITGAMALECGFSSWP